MLAPLLAISVLVAPPPAEGALGEVHPSVVADTTRAETAERRMEEILIELRIGRVASRLVPAFQSGDETALPVSALLEMGEVDFRVEEPGILRATLHPGARSVEVNGPDRRARVEGAQLDIHQAVVLWHDGELFLSASLLKRLFDLQIRTDWEDLTATVLDAEALPLGRRLAREARWGAFQGESDPRPPDWTVGMAAHAVGGLVGDWALASDLDDPQGTARGSLTVGSRMLGGAVKVSSRSLGPLHEGHFQTDASWHLARPGGRFLRQVRVGDALTISPRPRGVRGGLLTNAPYHRASEFGIETFEGRLGPGWEVELRRHGRTMDMTRADEQGAFALDVPVRYGDNALQVVAFGPHGEVVTMDRLLHLRQDRLPGGRAEWALSGGECTSAACRLTGAFDLRYGLSDRWTVRAGVESFAHDSIPESVHPYLELNGALTTSLAVSGEAVMDGFLRGGLQYTPNPHIRLRGAATRFDPQAQAPALFNPERRQTVEADLFVRPIPRWQRWTLRGSYVHEDRAPVGVTRWRALASAELIGLRWEGGVQARQTRPESAPGEGEIRPVAGVSGHPPFLSAGPLRPWIRADMEFRDGEVHRVQARLAQRLTRGTRLEVGTDWSSALGARASISLSAELGFLRGVTQYRRDARGEERVTQVAQGTFLWDEATGGVNLEAGPGVNRSGLSGFVYLDENGNGRWDPGEPLLEGVQVVVDGRSVRTDQHGRYRIWDLPSFSSVRVGLHELSIPNPTWVPEHRSIEVALPPASYRRLDLRVVPAGEMSGQIMRWSDDQEWVGVGGVEVALVAVETGEEVERLTTFSDGAFYAMGIRPGHYRVEPREDHLTILGLRSSLPTPIIEVAPGGKRRTDTVMIQLVPPNWRDAGPTALHPQGSPSESDGDLR